MHLYCIYYLRWFYNNCFNINILWINMCLHTLHVYDKVRMFLFLVIYVCMINRKTCQGFKAQWYECLFIDWDSNRGPLASRQRLPRNERICLCYNTREIECEYQFILICPCYQQLRRLYINQYYFNRPSVFKFIQLLKIENKDDLCKLAIYYQKAYNVRTYTPNNII